MDGGAKPLHTWEKLYWGVFVTALAGLLFSRLYRQDSPEPKVPCALSKVLYVKLTVHATLGVYEQRGFGIFSSCTFAERLMERVPCMGPTVGALRCGFRETEWMLGEHA